MSRCLHGESNLCWPSHKQVTVLTELLQVCIFAVLLISFGFYCQQGAPRRCVSYLWNGNSNRKQILALCTVEACFICVAVLACNVWYQDWPEARPAHMIGWLSGRPTDWLTDWLDEWRTKRLTNFFGFICWFSDGINGWLVDWVAVWIEWLIHRLSDCIVVDSVD
jgi:hypothetical protein